MFNYTGAYGIFYVNRDAHVDGSYEPGNWNNAFGTNAVRMQTFNFKIIWMVGNFFHCIMLGGNMLFHIIGL